MEKEQYQANYEGCLKTLKLLKEERKKRASTGNLLLSSEFNKGVAQQIRTIFLFGPITPEQEQGLYKNLLEE